MFTIIPSCNLLQIIVVNGESNEQEHKHIKNRSMGTERYPEYTKENEKGKVNQLLLLREYFSTSLVGQGEKELMWRTRKTNTIITKPGRE